MKRIHAVHLREFETRDKRKREKGEQSKTQHKRTENFKGDLLVISSVGAGSRGKFAGRANRQSWVPAGRPAGQPTLKRRDSFLLFLIYFFSLEGFKCSALAAARLLQTGAWEKRLRGEKRQ